MDQSQPRRAFWPTHVFEVRFMAQQDANSSLVRGIDSTTRLALDPCSAREWSVALADTPAYAYLFLSAVLAPVPGRPTGEHMKFDFPRPVPEIPVKNIAKAVAYYQKNFGFSLDWGGAEI